MPSNLLYSTSSKKESKKTSSTKKNLKPVDVEAKLKALVEKQFSLRNRKLATALNTPTIATTTGGGKKAALKASSAANVAKSNSLGGVVSVKHSINFLNSGIVVRVDDAIATVVGLKLASVGSVVRFIETNVTGLVLSIERKGLVKVSLFGYKARVNEVVILETNTFMVKCTRMKKGRVLNAFGHIVDQDKIMIINDTISGLNLVKKSNSTLLQKSVNYDSRISQTFNARNSFYYNDFNKTIDVSAPSIMNRSKVSDPLYTGTTVIDILLPIGKGQRQLIIGDRQTGKTTLAVDMIINQSNLSKNFGYFGNCEVTSVYVSIGQRRSEVYSIFKTLQFLNASRSAIIVASSASEPCTLQYLAAYAGCTLGEFFRDAGQNSVVIYDDLSKHAVAYRQMCLLLRRAPGRDAYPSDIFYVHSRLLERAASTREGTLTALPIVETQANDVSAYIPTNVISITDGQIFLESALFSKGIKPAINIGLSVSRIGAAAQNAVFKKIAPSLRKQLSSYRIFEIFKSFSDDISDAVKNILARGAILTEITKQTPTIPLSFDIQGVLVYAGTTGLLDSITSTDLPMLKELVFADSASGNIKTTFYDQMLYNKPLYDNSVYDISYYIDLTIASVRFITAFNVKRSLLYSSAKTTNNTV